MTQQLSATQTRAGTFDTVALADRAIRQLLTAGFSQDQLAVICPARFKDHFRGEASQTETPSVSATHALATGSALGATLGGLALAAAALTGNVPGMVAVGVYIGGGAIAGGFSDLIVSKGYEQETDDRYKQAIARGQIVVGVEIHGEDKSGRLAEAQRILDECGSHSV